ncbi:hypothetical protein A2Y85_08325 [candidate division WOR-3 bacterium RBG_13_43_14]|uniref:GWxTD domain-containing protein n=1 Tax=candidate division WOR-3 bacterium RBG_13_43_14 TaxID=1802590 RepID=A0A1F4UEH0_UNCW3|nr:MAG: hypothetical protein A2Y85_08325 [candidate division WOR-3 bacterium RBG_13_43_14]
MMIILLLCQIEWQVVNRLHSENMQQLIIYYTIPEIMLKYFTDDTMYFADYEVQLKVFDKKARQIAGDFWDKNVAKDSEMVSDSVKIIVPESGISYDFKIIDLNGGLLLNINDNISKINYLSDIAWKMINDTMTFTYKVLNDKFHVDSLSLVIDKIQQGSSLQAGNYEDSIKLPVAALPNGRYLAIFNLYAGTNKLDIVKLPVVIGRPFHQDETTWLLRVNQLEYIASTKQINELKQAFMDERDSLWRAFWKKHDPTPNTEFNEQEVEYFRRINYCNEHFSHGDKGWRSDRAKIYVRYGAPDEIQSRPYELYAPPNELENTSIKFYDTYEIWLYYKINRRFIFGDHYGLGQFILLTPEGIGL